MTDPRRLRAHKDTATCCIASRDRPGLVATSGEDGCVCWFDMRCKDVLFVMHVGDNPISSLCFKPGNEDIIYFSSGTEVKGFDVHSAASWKILESYNYYKEEINQIACNSRSCFLAAADDGGDVKSFYRNNKYTSDSFEEVQYVLPLMPWEVITAGLDSKLVTWDFSKGRSYKIVDFSVPVVDGGGSAGQCLNPAFIHSIAVPEVDIVDKVGKVCVVARADGVVEVINIESELAAIKSKSSSKPRRSPQSRAQSACLGNSFSCKEHKEKWMLFLLDPEEIGDLSKQHPDHIFRSVGLNREISQIWTRGIGHGLSLLQLERTGDEKQRKRRWIF